MNTTNHSDYVPVPGCTIRELLKEHGWTREYLAEQMLLQRKTINELIRGKAKIDQDTAKRLEHAFGLPADFWLRRETNYRSSISG